MHIFLTNFVCFVELTFAPITSASLFDLPALNIGEILLCKVAKAQSRTGTAVNIRR